MGGRLVTTVALLALASVAACEAGADDTGATTPAATSPAAATPVATSPVATSPAADLAPSQLTASTVAPPDTPPPCDPSTVTVWTAQTHPNDGGVDAVLRLRNDGAERCEVDVSASPDVDPEIEPDVWLEPGGWADLVLGSSAGACTARDVVRTVEIDVNGARTDVDTAAVVPCGPQLVAFFPNDLGDDPCRDLEAAAVEGAVVIRNVGIATCRLGLLTSVAGDDVGTAPSEAAVAVPLLAPGDVVAFALRVDGSGPTRTVELRFDSGAIVALALDGGRARLGVGPPQPWIGGPGSPRGDDPAALLAALDPFGA